MVRPRKEWSTFYLEKLKLALDEDKVWNVLKKKKKWIQTMHRTMAEDICENASKLGENWLVLEWCRYLFHAICIHFVFILSPCSKLICCCWMKHMNIHWQKQKQIKNSTWWKARVQRQIAHMSVAVARCTLSLLRVNAATTSYVQWKWCVLFILANFRNWFYSSLFFLRSLGLFFACKQTIQTQTK